MRVDAAYFDARSAERKRWESIVRKAPHPPLGHAAPNKSSMSVEPATREAPPVGETRPSSGTTPTVRASPDASGSGFVVTTDGYVVTNRHVVSGCRSITIRRDSAHVFLANVVASHPRDDLAIVRADTTFDVVAAFRTGGPIRPGDDVVAVGFPLAGLLADEPSVTTGSVSALAGIHNDPAVLQMSAPVQQGSSGGPLFDGGGNVVGIVVTKLNARIVAEETGDLPENVNFALKGERVRAFLDEQAIRTQVAPFAARLGNADVGDIGRRVTVMVECYR